jgi:hypothetical protein
MKRLLPLSVLLSACTAFPAVQDLGQYAQVTGPTIRLLPDDQFTIPAADFGSQAAGQLLQRRAANLRAKGQLLGNN